VTIHLISLPPKEYPDPRHIVLPPRMRGADPEAVDRLADSISHIGRQTPITVRLTAHMDAPPAGHDRDTLFLVAGLHRLLACIRLGMTRIPAVVLVGDDNEARLWEISENLHRAELTVLERATHIAEWLRITEEVQSAQVAPIESKRADGRGHRQPSGINAAVRELGIDRTEAQRAVRIDGLSDEAKETARNLGLDDNQQALLAAAREPEPLKQRELLVQKYTGDTEWYTPTDMLDAARSVLGDFDLDPASTEEAQQRVRATQYFMLANDGLAQPWAGKVWMNLPYAANLIGKFVSKLVGHVRSGDVPSAIMLVNNRTDAAWFHEAANGAAFFYFGDNPDAFERVFCEIGKVAQFSMSTIGDIKPLAANDAGVYREDAV
jgi:ParB-like chromosome segregation protein Spo0J